MKDPELHVTAVLDRVRPDYITRAYQIESWSDTDDFLTQLAHRFGKLLKVKSITKIFAENRVIRCFTGWRARY